jgi:hypothetical protein
MTITNQSGRGLPQSKAAAPRMADGLPAFHNRAFNPTGILTVTLYFAGRARAAGTPPLR